jgi:hypothetical protein
VQPLYDHETPLQLEHHLVLGGETAWQLASSRLMTVQEVQILNPTLSVDSLQAGQRLWLVS